MNEHVNRMIDALVEAEYTEQQIIDLTLTGFDERGFNPSETNKRYIELLKVKTNFTEDQLLDLWVSLSTEEFSYLLMQVLGEPSPEDTFNIDDKKFWLEVAEAIGPDWAQKLFHAAKFVTKVA